MAFLTFSRVRVATRAKPLTDLRDIKEDSLPPPVIGATTGWTGKQGLRFGWLGSYEWHFSPLCFRTFVLAMMDWIASFVSGGTAPLSASPAMR